MTINANSRIITGHSATGVSAISGAAPKTVAAAAIDMARVEVGTLSALCYGKAGTTSMVLKAKWQVSYTGSSWYDVFVNAYPTQGTLASQAGTSPVTVALAAPPCVYGMPFARCVVVSSGASGAGLGTDEASVSYQFRTPPEGERGKIRPEGASLTATGISGVAGTVYSGGVVSTASIRPGTLGAIVYALAGTTSMVITGTWQVSNDNTTWYAAKAPENPTTPTVASTSGTTFILGSVSAPSSVMGFRWARYALTTSGATGAGAGVDEYIVGHHYRLI